MSVKGLKNSDFDWAGITSAHSHRWRLIMVLNDVGRIAGCH